MFAARFYSAEDVGVATAIVSSMNLLAAFSKLGIDIGLIRFLPEIKNKEDFINSCLTTVFSVSLILSIVFVLIVDVFSPALNFLKQAKFLILFIIFTPSMALIQTQYNMFIGFRKAEFSFVQNVTWMLLKMVIVPIFAFLGFFGIFLSWGFSVLLTLLLSLLYLTPQLYQYSPKPKFNRIVLSRIVHFSFGNYIAGIFNQLPALLLPIITLNILGAEQSAYFYIAWMIANLLFAIPLATGFSLFAEGSHEQKGLRTKALRSIALVFTLLTPALIFILLLGDVVLYLFGEEYLQASLLLKILSLSSIFVSLNVLYINVKRIQKRLKPIIIVNCITSAFTIFGSLFLLPKLGISGIGVSWLVAQFTVSAFVITNAFKEFSKSLE